MTQHIVCSLGKFLLLNTRYCVKKKNDHTKEERDEEEWFYEDY